MSKVEEKEQIESMEIPATAHESEEAAAAAQNEPSQEEKEVNPFDTAVDGSFNPDAELEEISSKQKQSYGFDDELQSDEQAEGKKAEAAPDPKDKETLSARERKAQADLMSSTYDTIQSFLNSLGTGNDFTKYKFSKDVVEDLSKHMDNYMKESGTVKMPSWLGLVVAILISTMPKFIEGRADRRAKKFRDKQRKKKAAKQDRNSSLTPVEEIPLTDAEVVDDKGTRLCEWDGVELTDKQKRFCSKKCLNAYNKHQAKNS